MKLPPFQSLLDTHSEAIYRFLVASVGSNDADDCYQDTFMAALRAYPNVASATNLKGWLFTIAHHKAIDCHRRRRVDIPFVELSDMGRESEPDLPDQALWVRVGALPPRQRSSIALRFLEDLSYRTIGEITDCSEAAARQNVRAGLIRLRKEMEK